MLKKAKIITTTLLASLLTCSLVWVNQKTSEVVNAAETMTFPFAKGENSLKNAPTITGPSEKGPVDATWLYGEHKFDVQVDLTNATYLAVEIEMLINNPALNIGVVSDGQRFSSYIGNETVKFVDQNGNVSNLVRNGMYSYIGQNAKGALLIPLKEISLVGWGVQGSTLAKSTSIFIETNSFYDWGFKFKLGEMGYYTGDPFSGASMTKVLDLSQGVKKGNTSSSNMTVEFPEVVVDENNIDGQTATYPFTTQNNVNAMIWSGPAKQDTSDNWQTLRVKFDNDTDLSDATYMAIEYYSKSGAPGITYGVENNGTRYSMSAADGESFYFMTNEGKISKTSNIANGAITTDKSGCLLIPMDYFTYQFGNTANTLQAVQQMTLATNSKYNYAFEVMVGEIGYYTGRIQTNDFTFHKLIDLSSSHKSSSYTTVADNSANGSRVYRNYVEKMVYGDTTLVYTATEKTDNCLAIWDGGAKGQQTMTKDTYGDDAFLLESLGPREQADNYTAFTILDGVKIDWSNAKGVTLWARNDSDVEISFNLEVDAVSTKIGTKGRYNVTQGNRFWLYDVKTNKQTIYMTRPCITLPVGFEGWVRVPFEAFEQAAWSLSDPNYGAFPREYFMTEGCTVPYIGLTVFSLDYANKPFAINKLGGYSTTPSFVSALVPVSEERKDIKTLMGLN